jgi:RNA polymerase sigma-70 factor (ECF subfamily)
MSAAPALAPQALTDEEAVRRVVGGELDLFEVLMHRHNPRLYRALRSVVRDEAQIEELMQETYVRAYAALSEFRGRSQFSTWLIRIGLNEVGKRARRARVVTETNDDAALMEVEAPMSSDPEQSTSDRQLASLLERAVDALPEGYRTVFMLRQVDGLSIAETAEALGLSEEAVKSRALRANVRLRNQLDAWLEGASKEAFAFHAPRCNRVVEVVMSRLKR